MENPDLCAGFVLGLLVAGVLGFALQRLRLASLKAKQAGTKQAVIGKTQLTPWEAFLGAVGGYIEILFWILVFGFAIVVLTVILASEPGTPTPEPTYLP